MGKGGSAGRDKIPTVTQVINHKSNNMSLVNIVIVLIIVGIALWLINRFIPMDYKIKTILNVVVVIAVIIWLLRSSGLLANL